MTDYKKLAETAIKLGYTQDMRELNLHSESAVTAYAYGCKIGYNTALKDFVQALMNPQVILLDGQVAIETEEEDGTKRYWRIEDCKELKKKETLA